MVNDIMIKSFLTLAETQNFTKAASILFLSQQAVSKHISKLEEDLDCQLFSRSRGNIHLTEEGEIFLEVFSEYQQKLQEARNKVKSLNAQNKSRVVIGYLDLLDITSILGPTLEAFAKEHPDIEIEYHSATDWELPILLKEGKVDLSLSFDKEVEKNSPVNYINLLTARELLFVSKNHPLTHTAKSYMDFKDETVFFSLPPSGNVSNLLHRLDILGFPYTGLICTENMLSSCTAIDMMQGVSFAIEHSNVINQGNFATYETNNFADILLICNNDNNKKCVKEFMKTAEKVSK